MQHLCTPSATPGHSFRVFPGDVTNTRTFDAFSAGRGVVDPVGLRREAAASPLPTGPTARPPSAEAKEAGAAFAAPAVLSAAPSLASGAALV